MLLKNKKNIINLLLIILFLFGFYLIDFYFGFIPKVYAWTYREEQTVKLDKFIIDGEDWSYKIYDSVNDTDIILDDNIIDDLISTYTFVGKLGFSHDTHYFMFLRSEPDKDRFYMVAVEKASFDNNHIRPYIGVSSSFLQLYMKDYYRIYIRESSNGVYFTHQKVTYGNFIFYDPTQGYSSISSSQHQIIYNTFPYLRVKIESTPLIYDGYTYQDGDIMFRMGVNSLKWIKNDFPYIFQLQYNIDTQKILYSIMHLNPESHILKETFNGGKTWSNLPVDEGVTYFRTIKPGDVYQFKVLDKDDNSVLLISEEYEFPIDDSLYFKSFNFDGTTNNIMYDIFGLDDDIHILQKSFDGGLTWENVAIFPNTCYLDTLKWGDTFQVRVLDKTDGSVLLISDKYSASPITFDDDDVDDDPILSPPVVDNWWEWLYPKNWGYYVGYYVVKPIIDGFKSVINYLFVPNMDYVEDSFTAIKMTFDEKLPFVSQTVDMLNQLVGYNVPTSYPADYNPLPKISLPQYNVNNKNIIDLTYYSENRETIHNYIRYFAWFIFLIRLLKKAPKLISRGGY